MRVPDLHRSSTARRLVGLLLACALGPGACAAVDEGADGPPRSDASALERDAALPCSTPVECGDDNPCTDDQCVEGYCAHVPVEAGAPCRDNDLCNGEETCDAVGVCRAGVAVTCTPSGPCVSSACDAETGRCAESPVEGCCERDADCAVRGGPPCEAHRCVPETHLCEAVAIPGCCTVDADCAAGACETASCDPEKGVCTRRRTPGCCTDDADCPGDTCALARCDVAASTCTTEPVADCCLHDGDCPSETCERAICDTASNRCASTAVEGCCRDAADCAEDQRCDPDARVCVAMPVECCTVDAECGAPAGCFVPRCAGPEACCVLEAVPGCCTIDADCDAGLRCDPETSTCAPTPVEFAATQFPVRPFTVCADAPLPLLFGRVFVAGRTPGEGQGPGIDAEVGVGPPGVSPDDARWQFSAAVYNGDLANGFGQLNDDEYLGGFTAPAAGDYELAWRFRVNGGPWVYGDLVPAGSTDGYTSASALHFSAEDCARLPVGYAGFQHPLEAVSVCGDAASPPIFGRVYVAGRTPGAGQGTDVVAHLGYGPAGTTPTGPDAVAWRWVEASYNADLRNDFGELSDDEYRAVLEGPLAAGDYTLAWRFSTPGGEPVYGDLPPGGSLDGFSPETSLRLTVAEVCAP
jgi:hypothetical protein